MSADTTEAVVTVQFVDRIAGAGKLVALAVVEIEIAGVPILLQGVKVAKRPGGGLACEPPCFRAPDGRWLPAAVLPPDLAQGLAAEVFAAMARDN
jgi:stage V sporulation protein G